MGRHERRAVFIPAEGTPAAGESWRVFYGDPEGEWAYVDLPGLSWAQAADVMAVLLRCAGDGCGDCTAQAAEAAVALDATKAGAEWEAEWDGHALRITRLTWLRCAYRH